MIYSKFIAISQPVDVWKITPLIVTTINKFVLSNFKSQELSPIHYTPYCSIGINAFDSIKSLDASFKFVDDLGNVERCMISIVFEESSLILNCSDHLIKKEALHSLESEIRKELNNLYLQ